MFAAAHAAGLVLAEGFMYRHHPKLLKLKELVDSGAIGTPRYLRSSFTFTLDRPDDVRWDPHMGGGALWDVGCYPVSLGRYLFGAPERVEGWQVLSASGVDATFAGTLYFPEQRIAQFDCSYAMPFRTSAEVVGDRGLVRLNRPFRPDAPESTLVLCQGEREQVIELANPGRYWLEIEDMHDAILTGHPPLITPAETRGHVETLLQLYEAARGKPAA
jgi:predicted dehydrogenase